MIKEKLKNIHKIISSTAKQHNRSPESIKLLAVSKQQSDDIVRQAFAAGQHDFGENYLQEALDKQSHLRDLSITWHYIGQIQSNKTRAIAENFTWVHSVDRLKIAQRLSEQRPEHLPSLNICLQVNIDNESSKAGFRLDELSEAAIAIEKLARLKLRGLMAIPAPRDDFGSQQQAFKQCRLCLDTINQELSNKMDTLSMGMSHDIEAAIAEGASILRIGTAIFGKRH